MYQFTSTKYLVTNATDLDIKKVIDVKGDYYFRPGKQGVVFNNYNFTVGHLRVLVKSHESIQLASSLPDDGIPGFTDIKDIPFNKLHYMMYFLECNLCNLAANKDAITKDFCRIYYPHEVECMNKAKKPGFTPSLVLLDMSDFVNTGFVLTYIPSIGIVFNHNHYTFCVGRPVFTMGAFNIAVLAYIYQKKVDHVSDDEKVKNVIKGFDGIFKLAMMDNQHNAWAYPLLTFSSIMEYMEAHIEHNKLGIKDMIKRNFGQYGLSKDVVDCIVKAFATIMENDSIKRTIEASEKSTQLKMAIRYGHDNRDFLMKIDSLNELMQKCLDERKEAKAQHFEGAKLKENETSGSVTVCKALNAYNVPETLKELLPSYADSFSIRMEFDEFLTKANLRSSFLIDLVHAKVKFFGRTADQNDKTVDNLLRPIAIRFTFSTALNPDPKVNKVFKIYLVYNGPFHSNSELVFVKNYESYRKYATISDCIEFVADTRNLLKGNTSNPLFSTTAKLPKVSDVSGINKAINNYLSALTFKKHASSKNLDVYFGTIVISEFAKHIQFRCGGGSEYYAYLEATNKLGLEYPIEVYKDKNGNIKRTILGLAPNRVIDLVERMEYAIADDTPDMSVIVKTLRELIVGIQQ